MVKVKCLRTADCVVGGFRYASDSRLVGSLLLGLFNDEGKLDHVGFTSGIPDDERAGADPQGRGPEGRARIHGRCTGRPEPLVDRAQRAMGAAEAQAGGRGADTTT